MQKFLPFLLILASVGCAAERGPERSAPSRRPHWTVSRPLRSLDVPIRTSTLVIPFGRDVSVEFLAGIGDVNGDDREDFTVRLRFSYGDPSHASYLVLGSARLRSGTLTAAVKRGLARRVDANYHPNGIDIVPGEFPTNLAVDDPDGDGIQDTARLDHDFTATRYSCGDSSYCQADYVAVRLRIGSDRRRRLDIRGDWAQYQQPSSYPVHATTFVATLQPVGDWDGDGRSDVLYFEPNGGARILFLRSAGARQLSLPRMGLPLAADLTGDGRAEIIGVLPRNPAAIKIVSPS